MTKVVKKKYRLKKKPLVILLICITLLTTTIISKDKEKNYKENSKVVTKKTSNKKMTNKEKKLNELENIDKKISYFNYSYLNRYLKYHKKNPNLKIEDVIIRVNIGIDNDYYTNTKKTPYLNKSYILINKYYYTEDKYITKKIKKIDKKYARDGMKLVSYAKDAFEKMASDAKKKDLNIIAMSSYRSYNYQVNLYNKYAKSDGKKAADTYSARPGFSEHQTGLATDIYNGKEDYTNFEKTKEFEWMQKNAHKYGFILRFPSDKTDLTGYVYESWHYRYVGTKIATYMKKNNLCFEEYYAKKIENQLEF